VVQDASDEGDLSIREQVGDGGRKSVRRGPIVGAVDQDERSLPDGLEACGPVGRCDAPSNRIVRDGESLLAKFGEGGDRERDVFGLEGTQQRRVALALSKGSADA